MTVRVRFAPSPTGYLHIGGARTALYNYLYAQSKGGTYVLRIEDTDQERSKKEYEELQISDLKWLGIEHAEGPDVGGAYGPYRQSERLDIYKKYAEELIEKKMAFHCFCTAEELEAKKEIANKAGLDPQYDGKCRKLSNDEAKNKLRAGEKASIRFKAPHKAYTFNDQVRDRVVFPEGMVGDFVIMRSSGLPVYNYCCVIDDWLMKITLVIRAEEHLPNTLRQLMLYEAFNVTPPEFAHVSLLVGKDRQKLSKRHGATSVLQYREEGFLPEAMNNYLCLLGWSHPDEKDIFTKKELQGIFETNRFQKASAMFDLEKFEWVNGQHIKAMSGSQLLERATSFIPQTSHFHAQNREWKEKCLDLFKSYVLFFKEFDLLIAEVFATEFGDNEKLQEINSWPTTPQIREYLKGEVFKLKEQGVLFVSEAVVNAWGEYIKGELKIKGKPLFMGMRGVLTGRDHGPELKFLIPLTPVLVLWQRLK